MPFLYIDKRQVVEILPQVRKEHTYSMYSTSWVLMSWWHKEPGHQQPWCWLWWNELIQSPHIKGWLNHCARFLVSKWNVIVSIRKSPFHGDSVLYKNVKMCAFKDGQPPFLYPNSINWNSHSSCEHRTCIIAILHIPTYFLNVSDWL